MKCCICDKKINGYENDPWGALDNNGKPIDWNEDDRCCDECNLSKVLVGRIYLMNTNKKNN